MHETLFEIHRTQDQFVSQIDQLTQRIIELQLAVISSNQQQQYNQPMRGNQQQQYNELINSGLICGLPTTQLQQLYNTTITSATPPATTTTTTNNSGNNFSNPITPPQLQQHINHLSVPGTLSCVSQQQNTPETSEQFQDATILPFFETTTKEQQETTNQQQKLPQQEQNFRFNDYNLTEQQQLLIRNIDETTTTINDNEMNSSKIPLIKRSN